MKVVGLFAGIAGIESGLARSGHTSLMLCENDPAALAVLRTWFPDIQIHEDVASLEDLPSGVDLVAAGFPCQDLSQAGRTEGIRGGKSGLVKHVFRLLSQSKAPWALIENVPFMLHLEGGAAMSYLVEQLEQLGYKWAYRVVDSRAFGVPQRRRRVYLLASRTRRPERILFRDAVPPPMLGGHHGRACGFYWTEGNRGLGWAVDAVPTLKGGSDIGIPSPPAMWLPNGQIAVPDIRDAERLQGFPADWTLPAVQVARSGYRWKLVGNAVTVPAAEWIGRVLTYKAGENPMATRLTKSTWPSAAYGSSRGRFVVQTTEWPEASKSEPLESFLKYSPRPLSAKAATGFLRRLERSRLRYPAEFLDALRAHVEAEASARVG